MPTPTSRQLDATAELLTIRRTALAELPGTSGEARADRIKDLAYANRQIEGLAARIGLTPAALIERAEAAAEAACN